MSTAIIKYEMTPQLMIYCNKESYPAGLGFELLNISETDKKFMVFFMDNPDRFQQVFDIPLDIQYEYIIKKDGTIHCQESWYAKDKAYHGGGLRHGGIYDLKEWRTKVNLQKEYTYRRPEAWK